MKKNYRQRRDERRNSNSYWIESTKIDFVIELTRLLKRTGMSYTQLAEKLGKSPAYISKVFAANENLTIESMVKLTRALNGTLHIHIADHGCDVRWFDVIKNKKIPIDRGGASFKHYSTSGELKLNKIAYEDEYAAA